MLERNAHGSRRTEPAAVFRRVARTPWSGSPSRLSSPAPPGSSADPSAVRGGLRHDGRLTSSSPERRITLRRHTVTGRVFRRRRAMTGPVGRQPVIASTLPAPSPHRRSRPRQRRRGPPRGPAEDLGGASRGATLRVHVITRPARWRALVQAAGRAARPRAGTPRYAPACDAGRRRQSLLADPGWTSSCACRRDLSRRAVAAVTQRLRCSQSVIRNRWPPAPTPR